MSSRTHWRTPSAPGSLPTRASSWRPWRSAGSVASSASRCTRAIHCSSARDSPPPAPPDASSSSTRSRRSNAPTAFVKNDTCGASATTDAAHRPLYDLMNRRDAPPAGAGRGVRRCAPRDVRSVRRVSAFAGARAERERRAGGRRSARCARRPPSRGSRTHAAAGAHRRSRAAESLRNEHWPGVTLVACTSSSFMCDVRGFMCTAASTATVSSCSSSCCALAIEMPRSPQMAAGSPSSDIHSSICEVR